MSDHREGDNEATTSGTATRDLSISMVQANLYALVLLLPVALLAATSLSGATRPLASPTSHLVPGAEAFSSRF